MPPRGAHAATPCGPPLQATPHPPQFVTLADPFVSQPLVTFPSQFRKYPLHANPQDPPAHDEVALVTPPHAVVHSPQCAGSVALNTSQPSAASPLQSAYPARQVCVQTLFEHAIVAFARDGQAAPHPPQCAPDVRRSVSQPFAGLLSQSPKFGLQVPIAQIPAAHTAVAFANAQIVPHPPQFVGSLVIAVSHPLDAAPSQFA